MTAEPEMSQPPNRAWQPEKFAEPRTFPAKWDFSAFDSPGGSPQPAAARQPAATRQRPAPPSDGSSPHLPEGQPDGPDVAEEESLNGWQPDPFPEPRTFPAKWDLSGLV